ncbi:MAG: methyltransferase family protein [Terriglobia bacterium]
MTRAVPLFRWFASTSVMAAVLFLCAGRTDVPMMKTYLVIFAGLGLVTSLAIDSTLDGERRKPGPVEINPTSRVAASLLFLVTLTAAALDRGRFNWTPKMTETMQIAALIVLVMAAALEVWALVANPFFSTAIRIQADRGHRLVTRGPYRFVRHPGYLAMTMIIPATALALGSLASLIPALSYSALILHRTVSEDRFLTERLRGYAGYAQAVRYRLIPGLW